jgi:hypothetical protein
MRPQLFPLEKAKPFPTDWSPLPAGEGFSSKNYSFMTNDYRFT